MQRSAAAARAHSPPTKIILWTKYEVSIVQSERRQTHFVSMRLLLGISPLPPVLDVADVSRRARAAQALCAHTLLASAPWFLSRDQSGNIVAQRLTGSPLCKSLATLTVAPSTRRYCKRTWIYSPGRAKIQEQFRYLLGRRVFSDLGGVQSAKFK